MAARDHFVAIRQFSPVYHPDLDFDLNFTRSPFDGMAGGVEVRAASALDRHTNEVLGVPLEAMRAPIVTEDGSLPDRPVP